MLVGKGLKVISIMVPTCRQEWDKLRKNREGLQKFPLDRVSGNLTHPCCRRAISGGKLRRIRVRSHFIFGKDFVSATKNYSKPIQ
ncbi:unnamed protein product [Meloidogyne enterolobii]|uniref:Uncharacterized protein n=1 Tax=Meloidogyne enterolobii TaxID=390850 RepID=A0ACB0YQM2_MELEN